jgi:hypothetical protein
VKRTVVVVVALAAVLAVLVGASLAAAATSPQQPPTPTDKGNGATIENYQVIDASIDAHCLGEAAKGTATVHIVNQSVPIPGGYHYTTIFSITNWKAVGLTTGDQYVIPQGENTVENFLPNGGTVVGDVIINMVVSKGPSPNQNGLLRSHYILNEDGTVKVDVTQVHLKCTGPGGPTSPPSTASATATATPTAKAKAQSRP